MIEIVLHLLLEYHQKNPHRATATISGWKQRLCVHCGGHYRYWVERKKTGRGPTPDAARRKMEDNACYALKNEIDLRPCPTCGVYQPDMVAARRFRRHLIAFVVLTGALACAAMGLFAAGMFLFLDGVSLFRFVPWIVAAVVGTGLLAHLVIDLIDPNRNLQTNREAAWTLVNRGTLVLVQAGDKFAAQESSAGAGWRATNPLSVFVLMIALVLLTPTCELLRLAHGWAINDGCVPVIVAPGEQVTVYFSKWITAVHGYWKANGRAEILNADELRIAPELKLTTKNDHWGKAIPPAKNETQNRQRLWGRVELPDDPKLAGQTLQINVDLHVVYPKPMADRLDNTQEHVAHTVTVTLTADHQARSTYMAWYWIGGYAGLVLTFGMSAAIVLRTKFMRAKGVQTETCLFDKEAR